MDGGFHTSTHSFFLPSFWCVLAAARMEESNQSPICHLPFPLQPHQRPPIPLDSIWPRGLPYMTFEQKGEVKKYPKFKDKSYIFCGQKGGRGETKSQNLVEIMHGSPQGEREGIDPQECLLRQSVVFSVWQIRFQIYIWLVLRWQIACRTNLEIYLL